MINCSLPLVQNINRYTTIYIYIYIKIVLRREKERNAYPALINLIIITLDFFIGHLRPWYIIFTKHTAHSCNRSSLGWIGDQFLGFFLFVQKRESWKMNHETVVSWTCGFAVLFLGLKLVVFIGYLLDVLDFKW